MGKYFLLKSIHCFSIISSILASAQFSSFSSGSSGSSSGFSNSFSFEGGFSSQQSFPSSNGQRSFTNPGQLEFSNFVDLPSQRQREPASFNGPENLSPDCALALTSGGCISYQDINIAFGQAAESLPFQPLVYRPRENLTNEEIGSLGTVLHETTRILAKVAKINTKSIYILLI